MNSIKNENFLYCTYITFYNGNKLPPFYIGMSKSEKILNGSYFGSVESKRYKSIWKKELKEHPEKFKTVPITFHNTKVEAAKKELYFQKYFNVHTNPMYINMGIVGGHLYHIDKVSEETRRKMSKSGKGKRKPEGFGERISNRLKGVPKNEKSIEKGVLTRRQRNSYKPHSGSFTKGNEPHNKGLLNKKVWVNRENVNKLILKEHFEKYLSENWKAGLIVDGRGKGALRKRKWVNNGLVTKNAFEDELENYIKNGWSLGRLK